MNAPKAELKNIAGILNLVYAPTIRIENDVEYPMSQAERVQWLVDEYKVLKYPPLLKCVDAPTDCTDINRYGQPINTCPSCNGITKHHPKFNS